MKSDEGTSTKVCQVVSVQGALQPDEAPGEHRIATTIDAKTNVNGYKPLNNLFSSPNPDPQDV